MPINGVIEKKLRFLEQTLAKTKLSCFRDFVNEIRRACAGQTPGQERGEK
jgi:hypothetical protein